MASARALLASARAQLAQAQKALDDTIIRAPISGYVTERQIGVGEYVSPSSRIVTIVRANPIKLQLQIPGADASRVGVGMRVVAKIQNDAVREFEGKITALNPALDPNSRSLMAEAKFDNPKLELRPGMFATARVILPGTEKAIMAPREAVLVDPTIDSSEVFVVQGGKAHVRVVQVGDCGKRDGSHSLRRFRFRGGCHQQTAAAVRRRRRETNREIKIGSRLRVYGSRVNA